MFLDHIDQDDHSLFRLVVYSDPDSPSKEEGEAFDELVRRGYTPAFIVRELFYHWKEQGLDI